MIRLPRVVGLLLCRRMAADPQAGETSLVGLFNALHFRTFPAGQPFTVYAVLYGGIGEGTMELVVTQLETERDVYRYQKWYHLPGRELPLSLEIPVRRCVFPASGRYLLTLRFDGKELSQRYIEVFRKRG